VEGIWDW